MLTTIRILDLAIVGDRSDQLRITGVDADDGSPVQTTIPRDGLASSYRVGQVVTVSQSSVQSAVAAIGGGSLQNAE